jgi:predicted RND superfamily exporter protein
MINRARIESAFDGWARFVVRHRWWIAGAMLLVTAGLGSQVAHLRVDNSEQAFLHEDDTERMRYDRFREIFDREDRIAVVLHGSDVFDLGFLERLRALHRAIEEEVPFVEEVTSLVNARNTRGEEDRLIVEDLLERWPTTPAELEALRSRVMTHPLYAGQLISKSGEYTMISVKPFTYSTLQDSEAEIIAGFDSSGPGAEATPEYLSEEESRQLVLAMRSVVERFEADNFQIYLTGGPVFEDGLNGSLQRDVAIFLPLSLVVIVGLLGALFRRVSGVLIPLTVVIGALVSSMGLMAVLDIPFSITLNILPPFLLVVGVADSVHVLVIFYQRLAAGDVSEDAIAAALRHAGVPVVMTSLTTAAGLSSFRVAALAPIAQLGVIAPAGVLLAMLYSLLLLPALLAIFPIRARAARGHEAQARRLGSGLAALGDFAARHSVPVLVVTAALLGIAADGVSRVRFAHDALRWFPEDDPMRVASELVDRELGGASGLEVVVDSGSPGGLRNPELLGRIDRAMRFVETLEVGGRPVDKALSLVDIVKETHQALNENQPAYYAIPDDPALLAQELLLFENSDSDDLDDFTDGSLRLARISVRTAWVDAMRYPDFVAQARAGMEGALGNEASIELTGGAVLFTRVFRAVILTMARSYVFALLVITPMLVLLVGDWRRGLAAMVPNLVPIYLVLAVMGWADIPLDASTLLIGGILLGLVVDDTIHFMHRFNRYFDETGDPRLAVRQTLTTTGTALLYTTLIISMGFAVFWAAYLNNTFWFGLLASLSAVLAFLADIILGPALMMRVCRRRGTDPTTEPLSGAMVG